MKKNIGILLANLGTPNQPTINDISSYLKEFLMDKHVVDLPHWFWKPLLYNRIIPKRAAVIQTHYQHIWMNHQSPLLYYCEQLTAKLREKYPKYQFALGMNYGSPSLMDAKHQLADCDDIYILPLYPQYSSTTTQALMDKWNAQNPSGNHHFWVDYADDVYYIEALYQQIKENFSQNGQPETLLISYHGIPLRYVKKRRDPYVKRCVITSQKLSARLNMDFPTLKIITCYQSKFGKGKWTPPNTTDVLLTLAKKNQNVAIICPGFSVDCIETLYEIDVENRELFMINGGEQIRYIPALNATDQHVDLIGSLISNAIK